VLPPKKSLLSVKNGVAAVASDVHGPIAFETPTLGLKNQRCPPNVHETCVIVLCGRYLKRRANDPVLLVRGEIFQSLAHLVFHRSVRTHV
jgi:hypothetical protein